MSVFYGRIKGNRGEATRCGSKEGFRSSCQSWEGSVITRMRYNSNNNVEVTLEIANGSACSGETVFTGSIEELKNIFKK